jgi:hypothetical protein
MGEYGSKNGHPKPYMQAIFILLNTIIFLVGGLLLAAFSISLNNSLSGSIVAIFAIIGFGLLVLSIVGCIGSRF